MEIIDCLTVLGILAEFGGRAPAEESVSQADRGCSGRLRAQPPPDKEHSSALAGRLKGRAGCPLNSNVDRSQ